MAAVVLFALVWWTVAVCVSARRHFRDSDPLMARRKKRSKRKKIITAALSVAGALAVFATTYVLYQRMRASKLRGNKQPDLVDATEEASREGKRRESGFEQLHEVSAFQEKQEARKLEQDGRQHEQGRTNPEQGGRKPEQQRDEAVIETQTVAYSEGWNDGPYSAGGVAAMAPPEANLLMDERNDSFEFDSIVDSDGGDMPNVEGGYWSGSDSGVEEDGSTGPQRVDYSSSDEATVYSMIPPPNTPVHRYGASLSAFDRELLAKLSMIDGRPGGDRPEWLALPPHQVLVNSRVDDSGEETGDSPTLSYDTDYSPSNDSAFFYNGDTHSWSENLSKPFTSGRRQRVTGDQSTVENMALPQTPDSLPPVPRRGRGGARKRHERNALDDVTQPDMSRHLVKPSSLPDLTAIVRKYRFTSEVLPRREEPPEVSACSSQSCESSPPQRRPKRKFGVVEKPTALSNNQTGEVNSWATDDLHVNIGGSARLGHLRPRAASLPQVALEDLQENRSD